MGLFNVKLEDPALFGMVHEDSIVTINKDTKTLYIEGVTKTFEYHQSGIEETLLDAGGVLPLYNQIGRQVFRHITQKSGKCGKKRTRSNADRSTGFSLEPEPPRLD